MYRGGDKGEDDEQRYSGKKDPGRLQMIGFVRQVYQLEDRFQRATAKCAHTNTHLYGFRAFQCVSACVYICAVASGHDILGQCNKQFMSAHSKDYWCFH